MYDGIIADLRAAYDRAVEERETKPISPWKLEERQRFLDLLRQEQKTTLLEIGAGTGRDSLFFQEQGLQVTCTDLSPAMVEHCRQKGLNAQVMDFRHLSFPAERFDAVYALNCLLHVPNSDLPTVLQQIQRVLKPGGLMFLGVYGGIEHEGQLPNDTYEPKRFFSSRTDEHIQAMVRPYFQIVSFKAIPLPAEQDQHVQSLILRR